MKHTKLNSHFIDEHLVPYIAKEAKKCAGALKHRL
jgi:hypothetical protein